jgi:Ca2+-transporting ATPase
VAHKHGQTDSRETEYNAAVEKGLSSATAIQRLREEGPNEIARPEHRTAVHIVIDVFREPMFALLVGAGVLYLFLGDVKESLILAAFATLSVIITIVQESRSERVLESLRDLTSPRALVIRDGASRRIPGREVVRDDLIIVGEGDRVPADAIAVDAHDLLIDESLLTGESVPVRKRVEKAEPSGSGPGGDDTPFLYSGTLVVRGSARATVYATGHRSEIGKIGVSLGRIEPEPARLKAQTGKLVRVLFVGGTGVSVLAALFYGLERGQWFQATLSGIAVGMSMLPEEFPLVLTVFMAMGAWRISRARVLTRRADAIETLGAATVLCTDKTGTLTENRMAVAELQTFDRTWTASGMKLADQALADVARNAALASDPSPNDPMERAIIQFSEGLPGPAGPTQLARRYGLRPELLAMTNVWRGADESLSASAKGAPEAICRLCRLAEEDTARVNKIASAMAARGLRVLGVAVASSHGVLPESQSGFAFEFLGLVGLRDPLRENVPAALRECNAAGIRVIMITGDYPDTARAIAADAGFETLEVVSGDELAGLADADVAARVATATVFARINPTQKLRIVEALKANGEVVAMTGDGVNDAPALKAAHIGIAMGGRGTDVAREASSLVLLDDDFASIVKTIRLGRRIYDNITKSMSFILAAHVPIAGLALIPPLLGLPIFLAPLHVAFIEMIIDPACSIVFEAEPGERNVMARPPRPPNRPLVTSAMLTRSSVYGFLALAVVGFALWLGHMRAMAENDTRALAFATLVIADFGLIFANRSLSGSLASALRRPSPSLVSLLGAVVVVLSIVISWAPARAIFRFGPLHPDDLALCGALGIGVIVAMEMSRSLLRFLGGHKAAAGSIL